MKNVLVVVYLKRASPRITGLVKYLPSFGYNPILLSGKVGGIKYNIPCRVIETDIRDTLYRLNPSSDSRDFLTKFFGKGEMVSTLLRVGGEVANYPCPDKHWKPYALREARHIIEDNKIDAIISSSAPVISHIISSQLKKEYGVRWIADVRDLWSQNHNYHYSPIRRYFDRRIEVRTLRTADYITAISEPWYGELRKLHSSPICIIQHGYDPDNYMETTLSSGFTIVYTGKIYERQCKNIFFEGLEKSELGKSVSVHIYGNNDKSMYLSGGNVHWEDYIEHRLSLEAQQKAQILLAFGWQSTNSVASGLYCGKVFEYLGAKRPMLICGFPVDSAVRDLIEVTNSGVYCSSSDEVAAQLLKWYDEYKRNGYVKYRGDENVVSKYTHKAMAEKFAELLSK